MTENQATEAQPPRAAKFFEKLARDLANERFVMTCFRTEELFKRAHQEMTDHGIQPFGGLHDPGDKSRPYRLINPYPADDFLQSKAAEATLGSYLIDLYHCEGVIIFTLTAAAELKNPKVVEMHPPPGESRVFSTGEIKGGADWWAVARVFLDKGFSPYLCAGDQMVFVPRPTTRVKGQAKWEKLRTAKLKGMQYMGLCHNDFFVMGQPLAMTIDSDR